jgi:hypothetical protein
LGEDKSDEEECLTVYVVERFAVGSETAGKNDPSRPDRRG